MISRFGLSLALAIGLRPAAGCPAAGRTHPPQLTIATYAAGPASSASNSHLIFGAREALLVDVPMTRSDARNVVALVRASGRPLKTIFITHPHPDHFLALAVVTARFPEARVLATAEVAAALRAGGPGMIQFFQGILGAEAPSGFLAPDAVAGDTLWVDGVAAAILRFTGGEAEVASALYVPTLGALIAGDLAYSQAHLYLANRDIEGWGRQLDQLERLELRTVYPGHGPAGDQAMLAAMRRYFADFTAAVRSGVRVEAVRIMMEKYPTYRAVNLLEVLSVPAFIKSGQ